MKTASHSIASGLSNISATSFAIRLLEDEPTDQPPHKHDGFEMMLITSGSGTLSVDVNQHYISHNQFFCIKPGQVHQFCPDTGVTGFSFFFTESFVNGGELAFDLNCQTRFFQLFSKFNGSVLDAEMMEELVEVVRKIQRELNRPCLFTDEILKRYLKIFLLYLIRQFEDNLQTIVQTRNEEMVQSFSQLLDRNFKVKKMVNDYAGELCVTPNYLNEVIKKHTGYSAGYHIRQRIVLEAKRLALYSSVNMKEIAYELGFLDAAHFSKFFKMVTGNNFSQFKKEKVMLTATV